MVQYTQKKIAMINDLSGYGRCSLTVAIPILAAMKIQCCPVPTAILSNHTAFPVFFFDDYTDKMEAYADKWVELGLTFDGIVTGFLGSVEQIDIVLRIVEKLRQDGTQVIVDPIMGDDGVFYATYTREMCEEMKRLVCLGDVVTPNLTEACFLTDTPYKENGWTRKELLNMAMMLRMMGAKSVVITGVREGGYYTNVILDRCSSDAEFLRIKRTGVDRPGTGDVFSSVTAGSVISGESLKTAVQRASRFVKECIIKSDELEIPVKNGVCFEEILGRLMKK